MSEKLIYLEEIDPVQLYGINNSKLRMIQDFFPKLKIVARGNEIKTFGEASEIKKFNEKIDLIISYYKQFNSLNNEELSTLLREGEKKQKSQKGGAGDVLLYGNYGKAIKPKTENQWNLVRLTDEKDLVFIKGPAGTGKTFIAIAMAVKALREGEIKRIIVTRPAVEAGENLGFLPGDLTEKLDPYLQPIYDALLEMIPPRKLMEYLENKTIQIAPLAFMRGRTLGNAFVILDEAQNATLGQLKMFLTRMGDNTKFIVTGDVTQVDLPDVKRSGLSAVIDILEDIKGIGVIDFQAKDIVRHELVKKIVDVFSEHKL